MKFNVAKTLGVTVLTGGLVIAGLSWTGGDILDGAKAKLNEMGSSITLFKNNETKMKDKIVEMKSTIKGLEEALANGEGNATELQKEIDRLKGEVAKMEEELAKGKTEITRLEGELNLANEQANALKVAMDGITTETPMTEEEINSLLDGTVVTPPTEGEGNETPEPPVTEGNGTWTVVDGKYIGKTVDLEIRGNMLWALNKTTEAEGVTQPVKVNLYIGEIFEGQLYLNEGQSSSIEWSDVYTKIVITNNSGDKIEEVIVIK